MKQSSTDAVLAPLEFVVTAIGGVLIAIVVLIVPLTLFGSGSFLGFGASDACLLTPSGVLTVRDTGVRVDHLSNGVAANVDRMELCDFHASHSQLFWQIGTHLPNFLFFVGILTAVWLILRTARRRGLFSPHVALQVLRLGVYLLVGSLVAAALEAEASARLLQTFSDADQTRAFFQFFDLPGAVLMIGAATMTVGRVMAQSVRMQREIDATV